MKLELADHPFGPMYNTCPNKTSRYGRCIVVQLTCEGWRFQLVELGVLADDFGAEWAVTEWVSLGECPIPDLTQDNEAIWAVSIVAFAHPSFGPNWEG